MSSCEAPGNAAEDRSEYHRPRGPCHAAASPIAANSLFGARCPAKEAIDAPAAVPATPVAPYRVLFVSTGREEA